MLGTPLLPSFSFVSKAFWGEEGGQGQFNALAYHCATVLKTSDNILLLDFGLCTVSLQLFKEFSLDLKVCFNSDFMISAKRTFLLVNIKIRRMYLHLHLLS